MAVEVTMAFEVPSSFSDHSFTPNLCRTPGSMYKQTPLGTPSYKKAAWFKGR